MENPDILSPTRNSEVIYRFSDTGLPAAVMTANGKSRIIVATIPFESMEESQRDKVMKDFLDNLE